VYGYVSSTPCFDVFVALLETPTVLFATETRTVTSTPNPLLLYISMHTCQRGSGNTRRPGDPFHDRRHCVAASPKASHQTAGPSVRHARCVRAFCALRAGPTSRGCNSNRTYVSVIKILRQWVVILRGRLGGCVSVSSGLGRLFP